MKKYIIIAVIIAAMCWSVCTTYAHDEQPALIKGYATAYNGPSETTCTGKKARRGICGGCEAYIGKTIILYQRLPGDEVGQILGIWECEDTGPGTDGFREGRVIDVYCPTLEECQDFMDLIYTNGAKGKVYIQIVEADG